MDSNPLPEKKKRGRKSKKELEAMKNLELEKHEEDNEIKQPKKRGRKPRGVKIFPKINSNNSVINEKNNIILHLKCSLSDIDNKNYDENIEYFQFNETKIGDLNYFILNSKFINLELDHFCRIHFSGREDNGIRRSSHWQHEGVRTGHSGR